LLVHSYHDIPSMLLGVVRQGWLGVDLFFVLSGFLITGILWDSRNKGKYFLRFYGRRLLRIWPAYLLILFVTFFAMPLLKTIVGGPLLMIPDERVGIWPYLLMIQNLFPDLIVGSTFLTVTWSLAVEEQFYIVWPIVIRHSSKRIVLLCLIAGILLEPLLRILAAQHGCSRLGIYMNPLTHGDGLLCGAVVAIVLRSAKHKRRVLLLVGVILLIVGTALFLPIHPIKEGTQQWSPFVFTAAALMSTGILLVALVSENLGHILHRYVFMNQTLAFFGYISYSLYLYHIFFLRLATSDKLHMILNRWNHTNLTTWLMLICGLGLSTLAAWISRVTLERAALAKKNDI
jgi:peptidoglycan/LPS O-acetylase OafA/YrhL